LIAIGVVLRGELEAILELTALSVVDIQHELHSFLELEHVVLVDNVRIAQHVLRLFAMVNQLLMFQPALEVLELRLKGLHLQLALEVFNAFVAVVFGRVELYKPVRHVFLFVEAGARIALIMKVAVGNLVGVAGGLDVVGVAFRWVLLAGRPLYCFIQRTPLLRDVSLHGSFLWSLLRLLRFLLYRSLAVLLELFVLELLQLLTFSDVQQEMFRVAVRTRRTLLLVEIGAQPLLLL